MPRTFSNGHCRISREGQNIDFVVRGTNLNEKQYTAILMVCEEAKLKLKNVLNELEFNAPEEAYVNLSRSEVKGNCYVDE